MMNKRTGSINEKLNLTALITGTSNNTAIITKSQPRIVIRLSNIIFFVITILPLSHQRL